MKTASASDVLKINNLVPKVGVLKEILDETPDVKTFRISTPEGERPFTPMPGQLGMYSMPAIGEAMFSVTNYGDDYIDMSIKKYNDGVLTSVLHGLEVGQEVGIRGQQTGFERHRHHTSWNQWQEIGSVTLTKYIRHQHQSGNPKRCPSVGYP